jgi:hypothetical protein
VLLIHILLLPCATPVCILQDPELSAVMLGEDVAAMQQMLKSAYQVKDRASAL